MEPALSEGLTLPAALWKSAAILAVEVAGFGASPSRNVGGSEDTRDLRSEAFSASADPTGGDTAIGLD
jgi:hypothetical protein